MKAQVNEIKISYKGGLKSSMWKRISNSKEYKLVPELFFLHFFLVLKSIYLIDANVGQRVVSKWFI